MRILTALFSLSLFYSAVVAEYCYYDDFDNVVCRDTLAIGARIGIAVASFLIVAAIFLSLAMYRRRRMAAANLAFVQAPQNQQQVYPNQYPPPAQGGLFGNGQKGQPSPGPEQYNGVYNPQQTGQFNPYTGQVDQQHTGQINPQHTGQYTPQYNPPQVPPTTYDQSTTSPVAPPYSFTSTPQR